MPTRCYWVASEQTGARNLGPIVWVVSESPRGAGAAVLSRGRSPNICVLDPSAKLPQALGEIGQLFIDLPPPRSANANPMADIMAAMMGGASSAPKRSGLPPPAPSLTID